MTLSIHSPDDQTAADQSPMPTACVGCDGACRCNTPVDMADLRSYPKPAQLTSVTSTDGVVTIAWSDGAKGHFHPGWLRENDPSPKSRHPKSRERIVPPLSIREGVAPSRVAIHASGALLVKWAAEDGNHTSLYDAGWLHAHCYSTKTAQKRIKSRPDRPRAAEANWEAIMTSDAALRSWLDIYLTSGWSIVTGVPDKEGSAIALGQRIGTVRSSNFGFYFDVQSKAEPISNAYTAGFLPLHTDLPHYQMPPGLQILHCLRNEAEGGESLLSDGIAVAELLYREEREVFDLLAKTTVPFRFQDERSDYITRHPIIECDAGGQPIYINWSNSTMAPLDVPFEAMDKMRRAIRRFVSLVESPRFLIERKLTRGEALVFDNRRMLHGRTAFLPETGARHLQGCYLDTSEVLSRYEVLTRTTENQATA